MIHWAWLIPAAWCGAIIGAFALALVSIKRGDDK